jgi:hypothetical protein
MSHSKKLANQFNQSVTRPDDSASTQQFKLTSMLNDTTQASGIQDTTLDLSNIENFRQEAHVQSF